MDRRILVTGATGKQGGAVVRHLVSQGWPVRAMTRAPDGPKANALRALGAEVVAGDFDVPSSLGAAVADCHGVFSVQNFWESGVGYAGEVRQGVAMADAAKSAGVAHFVQASVASCETSDRIAHWKSKWEIEKHVRAIGLPATMVRSVFFMDNLLDPKVGKFLIPMLAGGLDPQKTYYMIAVDDIGAIVARLFNQPSRFIGRSIDVAGAALTVRELKDIYSRVTARRTTRFRIPLWATGLLSKDFKRQLMWHNARGRTFPIEDVRGLYPQLQSFETFASRHLR